MPPRPLLFDLDGTLVDTIALLINSMEAAFEGRTQRPTEGEWVALIGTPLPTMLRRWATSDEDVQTLTTKYRAYQLEHHDELTQPYPWVPETIRTLADAGHPMGIVTSKTVWLAERALDVTGMAPYFKSVVGIERTIRHKPEPDPVHTALDDLGITASERPRSLFIGDSVHDLHSGNAAGVISVAALWGPSSRQTLGEARPQVWLNNIRDLPSVIAELDARNA
jgi:pyrophosphatase PpaX